MKHVLLESITETEADGYYFGQFKSMDPITLMGTLDDPICLIHRMELERARNEGRFKEVYELVEYQDKAEQPLRRVCSYCQISVQPCLGIRRARRPL